MANFNLVVDTSNFKPYDISPALQILHDYRDAYNKLDELLNKIAEEKGQYIPPEGTKYRDTYDRYNLEFSSVVDDFSKGMNIKNAAAVRNLRRRYLEEITPINRAAEAYNKYLDKLTTLGPDAIIGNDKTFDDFYGGKNPSIEYRSAKEIQKVASGVMQGLDNALMKAPEQAGNIAKQYFVLRLQGLNGLEALTSIMLHNPMNLQTAGDVSQLVKALDDVYNTFSKDSFSDAAKSKIWENTMLGAIQGIQAPKYSMQHNLDYETAGQRASREYTEMQKDYYKEMKNLEEEEKNLKLGRVKVEDADGKYHYAYNPKKAKEILDLRRASESSSTKATPHITYGGHRYSIKKISDIANGLNTYEVSDLDTGEIVTDNSLKLGIVDQYNGVSTTPPPTTPPSPPKQPGNGTGGSGGNASLEAKDKLTKK